MLFCTGSLKEWTLILYGTSQNPYQQHSVQNASKKLENPGFEDLEEPEVQEEEEEYRGERMHPCMFFNPPFTFQVMGELSAAVTV